MEEAKPGGSLRGAGSRVVARPRWRGPGRAREGDGGPGGVCRRPAGVPGLAGAALCAWGGGIPASFPRRPVCVRGLSSEVPLWPRLRALPPGVLGCPRASCAPPHVAPAAFFAGRPPRSPGPCATRGCRLPTRPPSPASRALGKVAGVPRARGALGKRSRGAAAGPCVVGEKEGGALPCPGGRSRRRRVGAGPPRGRAAFDGRRSSLWVPRDRPCAGRPSGGETPRAPRRNRLAPLCRSFFPFSPSAPCAPLAGARRSTPAPRSPRAPPPSSGAARSPPPPPAPPIPGAAALPGASRSAGPRRGPRRRRCVRAATGPVPLPRGRAFPARRPGPRPGGRREPASPRAAPPGGGVPRAPGPRTPRPVGLRCASPRGPRRVRPCLGPAAPSVGAAPRGGGGALAPPLHARRAAAGGVCPAPSGLSPPTPPAAWCRAGVLWGGRFSGGPARPPASPCPLRTRAPCSAPRARHTSGPPPLSVCARCLPG